MNILEKIIAQKKIEIQERKERIPLRVLEAQLQNPSRGFLQQLKIQLLRNKPGIIAEIKKASPSRGVIREHFDVPAIAKSYAQHGATCLSVLTDERFFQGSIDDLTQARLNCSLPILRKDFIIDPYQVFETKAMDADCILLIVAALTQNQLETLHELAREIHLDVLIEVHNKEELDRALLIDSPLLGINNRDLKTFNTSLNNTLDLLPFIPDTRIVVTESGIHARQDVELMHQHGVHCFLVGESMMRAPDPGEKLSALFTSQDQANPPAAPLLS